MFIKSSFLDITISRKGKIFYIGDDIISTKCDLVNSLIKKRLKVQKNLNISGHAFSTYI